MEQGHTIVSIDENLCDHIVEYKLEGRVSLSDRSLRLDFRGANSRQTENMRWLMIIRKQDEYVIMLAHDETYIKEIQIKHLQRIGMDVGEDGEYGFEIGQNRDRNGEYQELRIFRRR